MNQAMLKSQLWLREEVRNALCEQELHQLGQRNVMIIDDCSDTLEIIRKHLGQLEQLNVKTYHDEFEAIEAFRHNRPDLLVIDMKLSSLTGDKLSIIMKNLSLFHTPVIYISSDELLLKKMEKENKNLVQTLAKPLKKDKLIQQVSRMLI
jgi:DNA-binding NtrC family response regulator